MNQPRHWTRCAVAFATRLALLTFPMLLAVVFLAFVEAVVLWRIGVTYTPKSSVSDIGVIDFEIGGDGRWGVSRVFYRRNELAQSCAWEVLLHDMQRPDRVHRLEISHFEPQLMSVTRDGSRFAIASTSGIVRVWDELKTTTMPRVMTDANLDALTALAFSPNGKWLFAAGNDVIYGWRSSTGELVYQLDHQSGGRELLFFSSDSTRLMFIGWNNRLRTFDVERGEILDDRVLEGPAIFAASLSFKTNKFATVAMRGSLAVVDLQRGVELWRAQVGAESPIAFSPDEEKLAVVHSVNVGEYAIQIRRTDTGQILHQFIAHDRMVPGLVFAPDDTLISWDFGGNIRRWDLTTQSMIWNFSARQWVRDDQPFSQNWRRSTFRNDLHRVSLCETNCSFEGGAKINP